MVRIMDARESGSTNSRRVRRANPGNRRSFSLGWSRICATARLFATGEATGQALVPGPSIQFKRPTAKVVNNG